MRSLEQWNMERDHGEIFRRALPGEIQDDIQYQREQVEFWQDMFVNVPRVGDNATEATAPESDDESDNGSDVGCEVEEYDMVHDDDRRQRCIDYFINMGLLNE